MLLDESSVAGQHARETRMKIGHCAATAITALGLSVGAASAALLSPVNISGYEYLLGTSCTIDGQPATCDVKFGGWTGGDGQVANGWTPFPGNDEGLWKATVNYTGKAALAMRSTWWVAASTCYSRTGKRFWAK
jgi:hypothetical protein